MMFICFFKQKTAYEMRISDWSSDVCSSDLASASTSTSSPAPDGTRRMKLYRLRDHGSLDHLAMEEASPPPVGSAEVLVRIRAAELNASDLLIAMGTSPYGPRPELITLSDAAGEGIACGAWVPGADQGAGVA